MLMLGPVRGCNNAWVGERDLDDWLAAGHRNRRTGNITRFLRCEHDIHRREPARLGRSFHGDLLAEMRDGSMGIVEGIHGVQTGPGATALARIPFSAKSWASPPVKF
jgi:hypothetical protein